MRSIVYRAVSRGLVPLVVTASMLAALPRAASAADGAVYTISDEDGYGIVECMHEGQACGRVIADSWCESHGHAHAIAYGVRSDITGSVASVAAGAVSATPVSTSSDAASPAPGPNDVVIRCGE